MGRILVLGSINMDVVVTAARHPQRGETIFGDGVHFIPGGKGANQALAAQRLGGDVALIGRLGRDAFGATLRTFLSEEGLDLAHLAQVDAAPTGTALITVSHDAENTVIVVSGANALITAEDVAQIDLHADDVVVSQFEIPQTAIKALFAKARAVGATTILNPAPATDFTEGLLPLVSVLVLNETELALFTQTPLTDDLDALSQAARSLRSAQDQRVIVTVGARGALALDGDRVQHIPGRAVQAVDTTGAGDCFVGALAAALSEHKPLEAALTFANAAASLSVQRLGAGVSLPRRHEVDEVLS